MSKFCFFAKKSVLKIYKIQADSQEEAEEIFYYSKSIKKYLIEQELLEYNVEIEEIPTGDEEDD